ncbi:DEAD/DEAH box helicase family protein [Candidatus Pacearchaeota archaeon]|nr:DEAD/DEAH box helicase family protein [Candidatus Pacearchaeota archaeon]
MLDPRDYQKAILETAKESNTLVVLPTGLGKTLIALMLSIESIKRHPGSKVLFLAPTRPLVEQHYNYFIKNLPELFADMQLFTGSVNADKRKKIFLTAEIIFSTPQCIANDLRHSLYDMKEACLLIIDEAHRCLKNYDYTTVVDYYKRQAQHQRILGLTASPGSDSDKVKEICAHLNIEEIEVRTRDSEDVKDYLQEREFQKVEVPFPQEFIEIRVLLKRIFDSRVEQLKSRSLLFGPANKITLLKLQQALARRMSSGNYNAMIGMSLTAQAIKVSHAMELLETQTLSGLHDYMRNLIKQAEEGKTKAVKNLVKLPEFNAALISLTDLLTKKIEHPKIEEASVLVENEMKENEKAKIMIFTQFRETASTLVKRLSQIPGTRPAMFIGQAKKAGVGLSQKEQKQVIEQFKEGEINVLVATSIGEEGLDIPEVNEVIFYEPIPSAIRKIQRAGRTARLAPGKLIILITKDTRDEIHHNASTAREKKMYRTIETVKREIKNRPKTLKDFT